MKRLLVGLAVVCILALSGKVNADNITFTNFGDNIVQNAGFEAGTGQWSIEAGTAQVVTEFARSGKHSLHYNNTSASRYKLFIQHVDVEPKKIMRFSAWIKGRNVQGSKAGQGASVFVQSHDANGKFIGGNFPGGLTGTFDWQEMSGEYVVPATAKSVSVGVYLRPGVTGEAWFDDIEVRVEEPAAAQIFLQYPNYRGMILENDDKPWKYAVRIHQQKLEGTQALNIQNTLVDSKGQVLFTQKHNVANETKVSQFVLNTPSRLKTGAYQLNQIVTTPSGEQLLSRQSAIQVVQKMPRIYIDSEGFTVRDGKRFFPMGIFLDSTKDEHLQRLNEAGFNTVLSYGYGNSPDSQAYLERAAKHNLSVIYSLKDMYEGLPYAPKTGRPFEIATGHLKTLGENEALLAWYINDELDQQWLPKLHQMYQQVQAIAPNQPAYQVLYQIGILEKYFNVTDILGTDPYPVGNPDLSNSSMVTRLTVDANYGARGTWQVLQSMDWNIYHKDRPSHPPSRDEMRNQMYQAIIQGANGILFYSYFDMFYEKFPREEATKNEALFKRRWQDLAAAVHEVNGLLPAVLENKKVKIEVVGKTKIETAAWQEGDELLIVAANPYYQSETVTLQVPSGWRVQHAKQGALEGDLQNSRLTLHLASVGSGIFRLKKQ